MATIGSDFGVCPNCGAELASRNVSAKAECCRCGEVADSSVSCAGGHFFCERCRSVLAHDMIERFCVQSDSVNPMEMALSLMRNPLMRMHGPVHHFLVPAVLLAAYYNAGKKYAEKERKIGDARKRAVNVLGGFCGLYGDCGAAVGTGIYVSLVTNATPLSKSEWRLSNLMTAQSLVSVANHGGPRCCKRNSFLSIIEAIDFSEKHLGTALKANPDVKCEFSDRNKECLRAECPFYDLKTPALQR